MKLKRLDECIIPAMPIGINEVQMVHREKASGQCGIWNAMVVRSVSKKELAESAGARKTMDTEYNKLDKTIVWDLTTVRAQIRGNARSAEPWQKVSFRNGIRHLWREG